MAQGDGIALAKQMGDAIARAENIWAAVESDLNDRGCFDGIDAAVMDELRASQVITIAQML